MDLSIGRAKSIGGADGRVLYISDTGVSSADLICSCLFLLISTISVTRRKIDTKMYKYSSPDLYSYGIA
jgi:hypothetical protein